MVSGTVSTNLTPTTDLIYSLGTPSLRWNGNFGDVIWMNATGTNTTSTNLFATNFVATSGQITDALLTNATATNLFATNATLTNLTVNNLTLANPLNLSSLLWTNATGVNTTSTNFFADTASSTDLFFTNATGGSLVVNSLSSNTGIFSAILGTNATFTAATTTNLFATAVSTTALFVNGQTVCLTDGTNCTYPGEADTLASVTARGATTSVAVTFFGGVTSSNLNVTGTIGGQYVNASSVSILNGFSAATGTIGGLIWTNATGTNTTSTNLFSNNLVANSATFTQATATALFTPTFTATNAGISSSTITTLQFANATGVNLFTSTVWGTSASFTTLTVAGQNVCLLDGTNCPLSNEADTLATVTARGGTTTAPVTFFGGVTSSNLNVTNTANIAYLNASSVSVLNGFSAATATIGGLIWTNATGVNTTTTNLFANNFRAQASTLFALTAGTVTVTSSASIVSLSGTGYTFTNGTTTNSTSTSAFVTNLVGTNATLTTLSLVNPITVTGISWVNATGTNTTSTNLATTNLTGTSATITRTTSTNSFATTASSTNNFFTTGQGSSLSLNVLTATTGTITNLLSTSSTISNLFVNTLAGTSATFSSLLVGGQNVCLTNGTNCPLSTEIDTLLSVTNRGASATATLTLLGGAVGSFVSATSFLGASGTAIFNGNTTIGDATSDLLSVTARINTDLVPSTDLVRSLGSATLRWNAFFGSVTTTGLVWTNATGTSVTTTNIFSSIASFSSLVATNATMTSVTTTNIATTNIIGTNATFTNLTAGNINLQPSPAVAEVSWTNSGLSSTGIESVRAMQSFNGYLYAGQGDSAGDGDIKICDPSVAGNALVCDSASDWSTSLDNATVNSIGAFAVYKNHFYAGDSGDTFFEGIIRVCTPGTTGNTQKCDSGDWAVSTTTGMDRITQLIVYEDTLYASGDTGFQGVESTYYCSPELTGAADICDASDWTRVVPFAGTYELINGLVIYNNRLVALMGQSNGDYDLLTCDPALSGNQRICDSTTDWVRTINNGAGRDSYVSAAVLNSYLYLGTGNDPGEGDLQRCDSRYKPDALLCDGTAEIGTTFDPGASITRIPAMINYGGSLWFGTEGSAGDGDIYQFESSVASTSHDTASLQATYSFATYNGYLYAGRGNSAGNGQVWLYQRPKLSSSRITFNTGTSTGSLWFEEEDQSSTGAGQDASSTIGVFKLSHSLVAEAGAYDLAEMYPTSEDGLEAGDVVAIDTNNPGKIRKTKDAYDKNTIGIVSTRPGFVLSGQQAENAVPVALAGRVPVKVTAEGGSIQAGDALAPSSIPGYAMKATQQGTIVGRSLESYAFGSTSTEETATVVAFVQTAYHFGPTESVIAEEIALLNNDDAPEGDNVAEIIQPANSAPEISLPLGSQIAQGIGVQTLVVEELAVRGMIIIEGDTRIRGSLYLGSSLSGTAVIEANTDRVTVTFKQPMASIPRVQVTARLEKANSSESFDNDVWDGTYYIANITEEGFEIRLPGLGLCKYYDPCPAVLSMDWFAYFQEPEIEEPILVSSSSTTDVETPAPEDSVEVDSESGTSTTTQEEIIEDVVIPEEIPVEEVVDTPPEVVEPVDEVTIPVVEEVVTSEPAEIPVIGE